MFFKPKKSLGQNFLIDDNILNLIADIGQVNSEDIILEVGPGTGKLTEKLLSKNPKKIFVIEKDKDLSKKLKLKFDKKINLITEDILKVDEEALSNKKMIFFGNLPYNISTQILVKWIRLNNLNKICKKFILMFQKEVAERIVAEPGSKKYGRLSILLGLTTNAKIVMNISSSAFIPKPKIESAIVQIIPKKIKKGFNKVILEKITQTLFNQRRKQIKSTLSKFGDPIKICQLLNIEPTKRPEELTLDQYEKLTNIITNYQDL